MDGEGKKVGRKKWILGFALTALVLAGAAGIIWGAKEVKVHSSETKEAQGSGQIFLYGEIHGDEDILQQELELWGKYYRDEGMRHLFIEFPCYTAEYLNQWMKAEDDEILGQLYRDWEGTEAHEQTVWDFYKTIKEEYPETIFHGTDVGHSYVRTGSRYLAQLREEGKIKSEKYAWAQKVVHQGVKYYTAHDDAYRENMMAENFIREYDKLQGEDVVGFYGSAHTNVKGMDVGTGTVPCMANQLKAYYGDNLHAEALFPEVQFPQEKEPLAVETITVGEKEYEAEYFGKEDLSDFTDEYSYREFWRLKNAYEDFQSCPMTGDKLPFDNYPMKIEKGEVFVIDYIRKSGRVERRYYRNDGEAWSGYPTTEEFKIE